jgi:hypothetical protein
VHCFKYVSFAPDPSDSLSSYCSTCYVLLAAPALITYRVALSLLYSNKFRIPRLCSLMHIVTSSDTIACHLSVRRRLHVQDQQMEQRMGLQVLEQGPTR